MCGGQRSSDKRICGRGLNEETGRGTSLVVHWLRFRAPSVVDPGCIPGQGTRSHMPQLRVHMLQLKILHAETKTWHSQKNK